MKNVIFRNIWKEHTNIKSMISKLHENFEANAFCHFSVNCLCNRRLSNWFYEDRWWLFGAVSANGPGRKSWWLHTRQTWKMMRGPTIQTEQKGQIVSQVGTGTWRLPVSPYDTRVIVLMPKNDGAQASVSSVCFDHLVQQGKFWNLKSKRMEAYSRTDRNQTTIVQRDWIGSVWWENRIDLLSEEEGKKALVAPVATCALLKRFNDFQDKALCDELRMAC